MKWMVMLKLICSATMSAVDAIQCQMSVKLITSTWTHLYEPTIPKEQGTQNPYRAGEVHPGHQSVSLYERVCDASKLSGPPNHHSKSTFQKIGRGWNRPLTLFQLWRMYWMTFTPLSLANAWMECNRRHFIAMVCFMCISCYVEAGLSYNSSWRIGCKNPEFNPAIPQTPVFGGSQVTISFYLHLQDRPTSPNILILKSTL